MALADVSFPSSRERANYRKLIEAGFVTFRGAITSEVFSRETLEFADELFLDACSDPDLSLSLGNLLWQHGLIGYMYSDEARGFREELALFYHAVGGTEGSSSYQLPRASAYRLHASLVNGGRVQLEARAPMVESLDAIA